MQFVIDITLVLIYSTCVLLLLAWAWNFWLHYIHQRWTNKFNEESIVLELRLPRDIYKSPLATETAIASLLQTGGVGTWYDRNIKGNLPVWGSLEIASLEGIVHFYVRVRKNFRELVEANFYAQYPGLEIVQVEDYTKLIKYDHFKAAKKEVDMWGASYPLGRDWKPKNLETGEESKDKMKADFLPIKTYVDYGLDKDQKEENKIDPITPLLEFFGSLGKGEYAWFQILMQAPSNFNGERFPHMFHDPFTGKGWSLSDMAEHYKKQKYLGSVKEKGTIAEDDYGREKKERKGDEEQPIKYEKTVVSKKKWLDLSISEQEEIKEVDRKMSKPIARTIIRCLYLADMAHGGKFNPNYIQNIVSLMKPYAGSNSFGFDPYDPYSYPWQTQKGRRPQWRKEERFELYVERGGFFPHVSKPKENTDRAWEDRFFYEHSMTSKKLFRMLVDTIFHPFGHPEPTELALLNLEEVASLWHLPGQVASTPTLPRIDSTKGIAPVNLPH